MSIQLRKGKRLVEVRLHKKGTKQRFTTRVVVPYEIDAQQLFDKLDKKFPKIAGQFYVITLKTKQKREP